MATSDPIAPAASVARPREAWRETLLFLSKLALIVFAFRSFLFSPFSIPSESMLPRLYVGDYLFISKWNYGYSRHSLPGSLPLIPGRILGRLPARGDVVVFKAPPSNTQDYIKRVIGLPGDTIRMRDGQVILNGRAIPKQRVADFVIPLSPNYDAGHCEFVFQTRDASGRPICRYAQYRETLPDGQSYLVLDKGMTSADDTGVYTVPAGDLFLMGDNRDDSEDSRFAQAVGGIGYVPLVNLEGKAVVTFWSTDGSANWFLPWTWATSLRPGRIGHGF